VTGVQTCSDLKSLSLDNWQKDPKTQLQELMQSKKMELPDYTLMTMSGLAHEQTFKVKCTTPLTAASCIGMGNSRKKSRAVGGRAYARIIK